MDHPRKEPQAKLSCKNAGRLRNPARPRLPNASGDAIERPAAIRPLHQEITPQRKRRWETRTSQAREQHHKGKCSIAATTMISPLRNVRTFVHGRESPTWNATMRNWVCLLCSYNLTIRLPSTLGRIDVHFHIGPVWVATLHDPLIRHADCKCVILDGVGRPLSACIVEAKNHGCAISRTILADL